VNHITLTGAVATEPRRRPGLDQPAVAFRLAVARPDVSCEPLHVDIVCPPPLSTFAAGLDVADHLAVRGRLDHHEWVADDGIHRARWQVIARELVLLRPRTRAA
jgi:hypothetical protein